jgi:hypothetical protein
VVVHRVLAPDAQIFLTGERKGDKMTREWVGSDNDGYDEVFADVYPAR